jgi:hypothetical protein
MYRRIAWRLAALLLAQIASSVAPAAEPAKGSATIKYVARIVEVESITKAEYEAVQGKPLDWDATLASWKKSGNVRRITSISLTAPEGRAATAESTTEKPALVDQDKFVGMLADRTKKIPSTERSTTELTING